MKRASSTSRLLTFKSTLTKNDADFHLWNSQFHIRVEYFSIKKKWKQTRVNWAFGFFFFFFFTTCELNLYCEICFFHKWTRLSFKGVFFFHMNENFHKWILPLSFIMWNVGSRNFRVIQFDMYENRLNKLNICYLIILSISKQKNKQTNKM